MNKYLNHKESKLNPEKKQTDYLNSPLSIKQIKFVVINFLQKKPTSPDDFTGELQ